MQPPKLSKEQEDALVDALAGALEEMMDRSCPDMGALWVEATRAERTYFQRPALGFTPSERYLRLGKSAQSKYRQLAAWRHAVVWRRVLGRVEDPDHRDALTCVYFTRYPADAPPYAWSKAAAEAPGVERFESPTTLKHRAKEGCLATVRLLRAERAELERRKDWCDELQALLLKPALRDSLRDVLKLEDHPWEDR